MSYVFPPDPPFHRGLTRNNMPVSTKLNHGINLKLKNSLLCTVYSVNIALFISDINTVLDVMEEIRLNLKLIVSEVDERQHGRVHVRRA